VGWMCLAENEYAEFENQIVSITCTLDIAHAQRRTIVQLLHVSCACPLAMLHHLGIHDSYIFRWPAYIAPHASLHDSVGGWVS
jgi:hypothetical protein